MMEKEGRKEGRKTALKLFTYRLIGTVSGPSDIRLSCVDRSH